jgi:hypothetical protein
MSAIEDYLASLSDDADEVDLSSFENIENLDEETWTELKQSRETMKRLKLPPSLLRIRIYAFSGCSQLIDVTFPSSLRSIEYCAFFGCSALAMHDFKLPDSLEVLGDDAFAYCRGLTGKLSTHITGDSSFAECTGLIDMDLENCKVINTGCFAGCTGLTILNLPSSLQSIGQWAFNGCTGLTGPLIIPPFVSFIHPNAFNGCSGLTNVEQSITEHFKRFNQWRARGNILCCMSMVDSDYRREVEANGGTRGSALSNAFLSNYSLDAQLIYKAIAHVDGESELGNGISRHIFSYLPPS